MNNATILTLARLLTGAGLIAGGGVLWALGGGGEPGSAMIGAGAALLPGASEALAYIRPGLELQPRAGTPEAPAPAPAPAPPAQ